VQKKTLLFLSILVLNVCACQTMFAQEQTDTDTTFIEPADTTEFLQVVTDNDDDEAWLKATPNDSTVIVTKQVDQEILEEMKSDPDMQYEIPPTVAESLWDRFWAWIADIFGFLFAKSISVGWGRIAWYLLGLIGLVILIMMLLKVDAFRMLYSGQKLKPKHLVLDEDIEQMDFEKLINEAISAKEYRRGVRLLFLYALRMLSDRNHIVLDSGKTNHDYLDEVKGKDLHRGFSDLNFYFEYAWYGNFSITSETFGKAHATFQEWKSKLR
jgi:hypothetical protein